MPNVQEPLPFGALLRRHRSAASFTQEALADRTGLGVRSIQHLEGGEHLPHRETVARLLGALGLTGEDQRQFERLSQPTPRPRKATSGARRQLPGDVSRHRAPHHNLPAPLTSFVGRQQEIGDVRRLLGAHRLVTLTGTGGCGKTRLALQVATELVDQFPDGVWLVELAPWLTQTWSLGRSPRRSTSRNARIEHFATLWWMPCAPDASCSSSTTASI